LFGWQQIGQKHVAQRFGVAHAIAARNLDEPRATTAVISTAPAIQPHTGKPVLSGIFFFLTAISSISLERPNRQAGRTEFHTSLGPSAARQLCCASPDSCMNRAGVRHPAAKINAAL